jgi:putative transcription antitermination factor YqgF
MPNTNDTVTAIPENEILLGIDYGDRNIGLAMGRNGFVSPLQIIDGANSHTAVHEITRTVMQNRCTKLIIGLPLSFDKKETVMSRKARVFAKLLKVYIKIPMEFENEYGTTMGSIDEAILFGVAKKQRAKTDHLSAALILKNYYHDNYGI